MSSLPSICYIVCSTPVSKSQGDIDHDKVRNTANFPEKISTARFSSFQPDKQVRDRYAKEIKTLKGEVKKQIESTESNTSTKLNLIDTVERLGLSYYFEKEIEEQLNLIFNGNHSSSSESEMNSDLGTVALRFRLFRQHGYDVSSDVFKNFTLENGNFKQSLRINVKNLLSLYEAAHLRTKRDCILDEALIFTTSHLSSRMHHHESCPSVERQVKRALEQSLHRGIPRVEAWHFISAYEADRLKDVSLLRLAQMDYNYLQIIYKQELSTLIRWWEELDLPSKLPYMRDRLVTNYFWSLSMAFEPHFSMVRILVVKFLTVGIFIDDTFDAYGTMDELHLLTAAMQRWEISEFDPLPEYIKIGLHAFFQMNEEVEQYAVQQGRSYAFSHVKEAWQEYSRASIIQSKWFIEKELPLFDEYMNFAKVTSAVKVAVYMCFVGMESANEGVFDWLSCYPPILEAAGKIVRLQNDLASHKFEKERGIGTSIQCYMKSYNVSEGEAEENFSKMYEDEWKHFNEEYCQKRKLPITHDLTERILNQIRIMDATYKIDQDSLTDPKKFTEPFLKMLLVDPFIV